MAETRLSPLLQRAQDAIDDAIAGMTDEQLVWHPQAKWSSAEILEHLSLAYSKTAERMKPVIQQERPEVRKRTFKEWAGGVIVLKLEKIPPGRKAPEGLVPTGADPRQVIAAIKQNLSELDQVLDGCERRFGGERNVLTHAVLGPLSIREWRKFHCVHTLHHMRQVKTLRMGMGAGQADPLSASR